MKTGPSSLSLYRVAASIAVAALVLPLLLGQAGGAGTAPARTRPPRPSQAEIDKVNVTLRGTDKAATDAALVQIKAWMVDWPLVELWSTWMPSLRRAKREQDIADLSLAMLSNPNWQAASDAISLVMEFRVTSLLALGDNQSALAAAKSYYNVCDIKLTPKAIDLIGNCLVKLHPDDLEIVRKLRAEQAAASSGTATGPGMLQEIKIDTNPCAAAVEKFSTRTRFPDRAIYANLLLIQDQGKDAQTVYRELYQLAATPEELKLAAEGIARCLRAEDGNLARANTWLNTIQKAQTATAPGKTPSP